MKKKRSVYVEYLDGTEESYHGWFIGMYIQEKYIIYVVETLEGYVRWHRLNTTGTSLQFTDTLKQHEKDFPTPTPDDDGV